MNGREIPVWAQATIVLTKEALGFCPNCGGGFEKRPTRPVTCKTKFCVSNYPVSTEPYIKPVVEKDFKALQDYFKQIDPRKR